MPQIVTMADIEAIESVPLSERNLPDSTYDVFRQQAEKHPTRAALTFFLQATEYQKSVSFTFKELYEKITQTANMFHHLGIGPGDTVSYITGNTPQVYFTLYGGEAAGIANPINPLLEPDTIAEIMNAAQTKVLVTFAPFPKSDLFEKSISIANKVPSLKTILTIDLANYLGGVKKIAVNFMRRGQMKVNVRPEILDFDKTLAKFPKDRLTSGRKIKPEEIAAYFHTGGTTGTPKLAKHTHRNQVFDSWGVGVMVDGKPGDVNFLGLPLFHNYGAIAIGLGTWQSGAGVLMASPSGYRGEGIFDNFWKIVDHYNVTMMSAVPTVFKALLNVPVGDANISTLKVATCGAAPLPVELARQFSEMSGVPVLEGYGLTEGTSVNSVNPMYGDARIGSVGFHLPYQEMKVAIMNGKEFERWADTEEVGIIALRGPNVFAGYSDDFYNDGVYFEDGDGQGRWLNTGDMGMQDADGYTWLTGRKKELIIRGGHNIDPKQIEEPMHRHPAVALAASVGRPDARVGEMPVAYVELKPGERVSEDDLLKFASENIGERAAVPKRIYILDQIPLTAVGKVFKPQLVREQVEDVYSAELDKIESVVNHKVVAEGDKRLGTIARVEVEAAAGSDKEAVEQTVRQALGNYTVHYDLKVR